MPHKVRQSHLQLVFSGEKKKNSKEFDFAFSDQRYQNHFTMKIVSRCNHFLVSVKYSVLIYLFYIKIGFLLDSLKKPALHDCSSVVFFQFAWLNSFETISISPTAGVPDRIE